jgi:hypothetical protein
VLRQLIEQDYIKQRLMSLDAAVVAYEPKLAKAFHKEADPGSGSADHICQRFLRHWRNKGLRFAGFSKFRHNEKNPRQALLAGVEKLVDKIGLDSHAAGQQEFKKYVREYRFIMHHANHFGSLDLEGCAGAYGGGGRQTQTEEGGK